MRLNAYLKILTKKKIKQAFFLGFAGGQSVFKIKTKEKKMKRKLFFLWCLIVTAGEEVYEVGEALFLIIAFFTLLPVFILYHHLDRFSSKMNAVWRTAIEKYDSYYR